MVTKKSSIEGLSVTDIEKYFVVISFQGSQKLIEGEYALYLEF